jgi:hypothetical protein
MFRSLCRAFLVAGLAFQAVVAEDLATSFEDSLGGCGEEAPGSTNLLQTQLSLNKRQVHEAHKEHRAAEKSAWFGGTTTTKTTTPPATGVGQNGVGNLPTFLTGLVTDFFVIALCIWIYRNWSAAYPILFGKGNTTKYGEKAAQVPDQVIAKTKMDERMPANKTWLQWAYVSWALSYEDIASAAGLDKAMLIMYIDKCRRAFKWIAIPMFCLTGPLNCFFGGNAAGADHQSWFSLGNVQYYSWLYWVTGFACCYVAFIVCNMVCIDGMKEFQGYRRTWLLHANDVRSRTLMMTGIPDEFCNEAKCKIFWNGLTTNLVESVYITKDVTLTYFGDDPEFSALHESPNASMSLEKMIQQKDATVTALAAAKHDENTEAQQSCEYDLRQLNKDIALMQKWMIKNSAKDTLGDFNLSTGFITFKTRHVAELALNMNLGDDYDTWQKEKAPQPVDIIWSDFTQDPTAGSTSAILGYALTFGMMCIYMPFVVAIANLAEAIDMGPLQELWASEAPSIGLTLMVDFLPTFLVLIFTSCFAVYDKSLQQYKLSVWYFWMNMLFVVLVTAVGVNFLNFVTTLANDPLSIFQLLASTMPSCTHYYMNYLGMQWYSMAMQLTRYMNVLKFRIFARHHEEEDARSLAEPEDQDYYGIGARTARFSTLVTIGIVYGTLSPPCSVLAWMTVTWIRTLFGYIWVFCELKKPDLGGAFFHRALQNTYAALHVYFILMTGVLYYRGSNSGPAIVAACGWAYVFHSHHRFFLMKWEHIKIDDVFLQVDEKDKRPLNGKYVQPEFA